MISGFIKRSIAGPVSARKGRSLPVVGRAHFLVRLACGCERRAEELGSICPVQRVLAPLLAASFPATSHSSLNGCFSNAPPSLPCLKNQRFVLFFNLFLRCCFELQHLLPGGAVGGLLPSPPLRLPAVLCSAGQTCLLSAFARVARLALHQLLFC